ncbi:MAG: polyprenyl synthetase family protein [Devosia sp.]|nr:polyprenyl synthetase family protein [Devosia sp.]
MSDPAPNDDATPPAEGLARLKSSLEARLKALVKSGPTTPRHLREAVRHALLAPSKRVRPMMVHLVAAGEDYLHLPALDAGCAVEMVHTASLILDDLPCMDDAKTRRQRPTTHIVFGEATAILAAIALLNRAFGVIAELDDLSPSIRTQLAEQLSGAVGWEGLVSGQELDLRGTEGVDPAKIERLNWLKTGVLFVAAAEMGATIRGLAPAQTRAVRSFATHLGQAFQTADDLLDVSATAAQAGKDVGQDLGKTTIVSLLGQDLARQRCREHLASADRALAETSLEPQPFRTLIGKFFGSLGTEST